jgi:hypothetical protein
MVVVVVMGWGGGKGRGRSVRCMLRGGVVVLYLGDMNAMDRDLNNEPAWGCLVPMRRRG